MITLEDVDYTLDHAGRSLEILKKIHLAIPRGQTAALVGPSGSGKSSLLALIAGVERPGGGVIRVDGLDFAGRTQDELARFRRGHLGIVFQDFHLVPALTALENAALPLELAGNPEALARAREMLDLVGLAERLGHRPPELSGGEQQRVAIARAFVARPPLVLADEPTGNLDQDTSQRIMDLLFSLVRQWRTTLLLVTHDAQLVARADRLYRLDHGQLREQP